MNLFDENNKYTEETNNLSSKTLKALSSIFAEYVEKGYNPREISHLMHIDVTELELRSIAKADVKRARAARRSKAE